MTDSQEDEPGYKERYVAFLDILGFAREVRLSADKRSAFFKAGSALASVSSYLSRARISRTIPRVHHLTWEGYWFSDCFVVTGDPTGAGLRDVLAVSHYLSGELLREKGLLLRGAVTLGKVYESPNVLFGPALVEAHDLEKAARYPRIILSNEVATSGDIEWMDKGANPTRCFTFCTIDGTTYLDSLRTFCTWIGTGDTPAYMTSEEWMRRWREVAEAGVAKYVAEPRVREKYEWMIEEHERVFALGERGDPTGY